MTRYQFSIDRGGTFTDCILFDRETQERRVTKVLSSPQAPVVGIRQLLNLGTSDTIPPSDVRMGTTVATNALLERKGRRTCLLITRGFADLLDIGTQARPDLFSLDIRRPAPLQDLVLEVSARLDPSGAILERPEEEELQSIIVALEKAGVESIAVSVLHSYKNPELERFIGARLRSAGFEAVFLSHEAVNEMGFLGRTSTAVVDAYLTPLLTDYLEGLAGELPQSRLRLMQSAGGLATLERARGSRTLLSGPAGGIIAAERVAEAIAADQLITFDMGGTSSDVSLFAGAPDRVFESEIEGHFVRAPSMDIHTVAAGGGSVCRFDGQALTVGPDSVGSIPGPLCYGNSHGTELSVTDVNLLLGRLVQDHFPFPLDIELARGALEKITRAVRTSVHGDPTATAESVALGFTRVLTTKMAEAIAKVTVGRGLDARDFSLLVFGGAGGQHACDVARHLGIRRVISHELSGVLSAFGIGLSDLLWTSEVDGGGSTLDGESLQRLSQKLEHLGKRGTQQLLFEQKLGEGVARGENVRVQRSLELRYAGTSTSIVVPLQSLDAMKQSFEERHEALFGFSRPGVPVVIFAGRIECTLTGPRLPPVELAPPEAAAPPQTRVTPVVLSCGTRQDVPIYELEALRHCGAVSGPALILSPTGTFLVESGFRAWFQEGYLVMEDLSQGKRQDSRSPELEERPDVALLEVMAARFSSIAEQMGQALRRSAASTNIRDRLDFSCALFDCAGQLVANAPHIPVHLGAMSESVRATLRRHPHLDPGDVIVTNDPSLGGSHLPDITVITPVFDEQATLRFFTASRGHHADVGGITPGSMPPNSRSIEEEGVVFSADFLVQRGVFQEQKILDKLTRGPHPARRPQENLGDLRAQVAANNLGRTLLRNLCLDYGTSRVERYMHFLHQRAEEGVRQAIARLPSGKQSFTDYLDDGSAISVSLEMQNGQLLVDFSGTAAQQPGNLNAPRAVTLAAVLYFLRCQLTDPLPLNEGCLRPVKLVVPEGSLLHPSAGAAVAAGNVETSQRVVDVLFGASGIAAASQGTMNNLSFGDGSFGYYETIGGGAGATARFDGASGVHTHMTNTRITDVEILESLYPIRVLEFRVRKGSGGDGAQCGGDGIVRELLVLSPLEVSMLSQRRSMAPFGLHGGHPGAPGRNLVDSREAPGSFVRQLAAGTRLRIETPGGGGYGAPGASTVPT